MTDFWKGYTRDPEMTEQIIAAIRDILYTYPTMRTGQAINNAIRTTAGHSPYLATVYDETLLDSLRKFTEQADA